MLSSSRFCSLKSVVLFLSVAGALGHGAPAAAAPPSGPARLVADLASISSGSETEVEILGRFAGHVYFAATEPVRGPSLWRTDGSVEGTEPVADLCPGPCGPSIGELVAGEDRAWFSVGYFAPDAPAFELWTTDGTRRGTERLLRLQKPGERISELAVVGDRLFFAAGGPTSAKGEELWVSDGTREGTALFADVCPGSCSSNPQEIVPFGTGLAFVANAPNTGFELRTADPATGEVELVRDICAGPCGVVHDLAAHDGRLYFSALDEAHGEEPWSSDGSAAGTWLLLDGRPGSTSGGLMGSFELDGQVYLAFLRSPDDSERHQLWTTDGTPAGTAPATQVLGGLEATAERLLPRFAPPTASGLLYFVTASDATRDTLWVYDAPAGLTRALRDGLDLGFEPFEDRASGDTIVFAATDHVTGIEPWVSDGTVAGTKLLRDIRPGARGSQPRDLTTLGDRVLFTVEDEDFSTHLWTTDRTTSGTQPIAIAPASSSSPRDLTAYSGRLWFTARSDGGLRGLWRTTVDGDDVELVDSDLDVEGLTVQGSRLYFVDRRTGVPMTLDPDTLAPVTLAPSQPARELTLGPGGFVYFGTRGAGEELWRTDGTAGGTVLIANPHPDWFDPCTGDDECPPAFEAVAESYPDQLTAVGGLLYFTAVHPQTIELPGLWRTDGTAQGTVWLPLAPVGIDRIVSIGDRIVFTADVPGDDEGSQVWTASPGSNPSILTHYLDDPIGGLTAAGGVAYYLVEHKGKVDLHRTTGTIASSLRVATLTGASRLEDVGEIAAAGSRLYFSLRTSGLGSELWTSDGTEAGTGLVADLFPGPRDSRPSELTPVGPYLVFAADDGESGHEPWVTDGTAAGTHRLADVAPGPEPSSPLELTRVRDALYFSADDGSGRGREVWALDAGGEGGETPPEVPDDASEILSPEYPGFRFWVRITASGQVQPARREIVCIPETVCVSGAIPGRSEVFLRVVGPKPNGHLWPTLVRFTTSRVDVWIEQVSTGIVRHYVLDAATPGSSDLDGLFDRFGFPSG